jgi:hypothetical protein
LTRAYTVTQSVPQFVVNGTPIRVDGADACAAYLVALKNKAPEVLKTPGASFLVAGEGFASSLRLRRLRDA